MRQLPEATRQAPESPARALFKSDHPRRIDRHIDFFGAGDAAARDMCGEALLEALTRVSADPDELTSCA